MTPLKMTSLRRELLAWLVPIYVVAAFAAMLTTYILFGRMTGAFMDNQLRVIADSHAQSGPTGPPPTMRPLSSHDVVDKGALIVQIWGRDERLLATSWPALALPRQSGDGFRDVTLNDHRWRVYTLHTPDRTVQSAQCLEFREHVIRDQAVQTGLPVAALIPISALIVWLAIQMVLRRLERVARTAAAQDEHSFGDLPLADVPCEIHPLVSAVNNLLGRLRSAFASQRRFVQDAAHELRTPITAMSLQLENLKTRLPSDAAPEQIAQLEAGLARTRRMVEQLLRLARQEGPRAPDPPISLQIDEFLKSLISDFVPLADHRGIDLGYAASVTATVRANQDDLRSLLHNLIDNALRYSPRGGIVDVTLHNDNQVVTIEIVDSGPGIPAELLPRVFDRFFRIEGTDTEGSGLGLAIARHAAERNHIDLELCNRIDGAGLVARVRFGMGVASDVQPIAGAQPIAPADLSLS
jgi:two-component system, OmpR family, sensor kinase